MNRYDPDVPPDPQAWLAMDESSRISLINSCHASHGEFGESLLAHAAMHAAIETQLASSEPVEATQALQRLVDAGLSRHDAVHAIGTVLADFIFAMLKSPDEAQGFDQSAYASALSDLTVSSWLGIGKR